MPRENLNIQLVAYVNAEAKKVGLGLDTYDADWFVATIEKWLGDNNAALTVRGVRRFVR